MTKLPTDPIAAQKYLHGGIETHPKVELNAATLATFYTPGVGKVSSHLAKNPADARDLTIKRNSLAVVSDGSAVLGLGNIGPYGALPVMEGKSLLFKSLAGIDAWPLVLDTQDTDAIVAAVKATAPAFGALNLEDIAAPRCYEIEERLQRELDIPVMHDDQHATAIVALAALINAFQVVGKSLKTGKIVVVGAGAAGSGILRLLVDYGVQDMVMVDSKGIVEPTRPDLDPYKQKWAKLGNPRGLKGSIEVAFPGADAVIGVTVPGAFTTEHIRSMTKDPIVFALANPVPEVMPNEAKSAGAAVVATGRSDFPNQINNVLVFPGIFRGMLDSGVQNVTSEIKLRAATALAHLVPHPTADHILPSVLDDAVVPTVADAVIGTEARS